MCGEERERKRIKGDEMRYPWVKCDVGDIDGEVWKGFMAAHHATRGVVLEESPIRTVWWVAKRVLPRYVSIFKKINK